MSSNNYFEHWYMHNEEFLSSNDVSKEVAEIIWNSAKASTMHDIVAAIQDGSLRIELSF